MPKEHDRREVAAPDWKVTDEGLLLLSLDERLRELTDEVREATAVIRRSSSSR